MVHSMQLEEQAKKKLEEFLQNVQNTDFLWLDEILEEAVKMFSNNSDREPEMMPKTPSQKNRRKKRFSSVKKDSFSKKRLSKRTATRSSKRIAQQSQQKKDLEIMKTDEGCNSPCVTRSQALKFARHSDAALKNSAIHLAKGRIPLVEISINERNSAEFQLNKTPPEKEKTALTFTLSSDKSPERRSQALSKVSLLVVPDTPEAKIMKEGREACKLKIANASIARTTEDKEASAQEENSCVQQHFRLETTQSVSESPQTPTAPKANRHSVRRSLIGRNPKNCQASLVERCSLSAKRERLVQKSIGRTLPKRKTTQRSPSASRRMSSQTAMEKLVDEQITESGPELDPASHSQEASLTATAQPREEKEGGDCKEGPSEKCKETQMHPQSARRKPSYKRAVSELDDGQPTEDELSPPRKKPPSPQCPSSKVVRPLKTFLHTVHKNQLLMMTPGSVTCNSTIKSFLRQNTPLRTTPKEKERQRLENLKKKEEVEQQRRLKLEEEKRRRLEEMKRKREERLRKVLQARERVEQLEEEKKKKLEQKHAQHVEKNEKVREEKMAEDKVRKKVAAKKLEELEARRKQEEARKQRAPQLEEEERKHKELLQKKKEEEQEKARKIAEQHQADLEREKQLSAERELEKKREQEKLQAQREHERQEKEKAASLQRELLAAAKEKERLKKEMEEKERILEHQKQVAQQPKEMEAAAATPPAQLNVTVDVESSLACNSYQMTPQGPKQPKLDLNNYGMDLNSDDSTDDESQPRKPIPAWATGNQLSQAIIHQYYHPPDTKVLFGVVKSPKLEEIFYKSKPRYFKRTSSAVWNSPPFPGGKSVPSTFKRC